MATVEKRKRVRFTLDVKFASEQAKEAFLKRLNAVRDLVTPEGSAKVDNYGLLSALFSLAESSNQQPSSRERDTERPGPTTSERQGESAGAVPERATTGSFLSSGGKCYKRRVLWGREGLSCTLWHIMKPQALIQLYISAVIRRRYTLHTGVYTGDVTPEDQQLFIVERRAFVELCSSLVHPCSCWNTAFWRLQSVMQVCTIII